MTEPGLSTRAPTYGKLLPSVDLVRLGVAGRFAAVVPSVEGDRRAGVGCHGG